ncbi:hypothetical protein CONCODRAFT_9783 [Conidiobolus coronatus NRRL 28638]|uniref:U3 small nucleolar RNA-associated protein 10 n=1 Tax=Conidiobolus coronatus (strain ATCC 28846 / CBS 209.66 / NRRL 28638) TaxID=796925 RepID=A0A137NZ19_CONC2|nr:hypothetical protein CONCODRAFT_9783 [Conidiobolus coronatus NRRL 28638]|eukprot:KXN68056.1 hypothetical protein CONCODRAFT_9783 [Conidiobolus coronatus NRRL 28638]
MANKRATPICKFDSSVLTSTPIRINSIGQCLRLSTNPQTYNSALLLLATISQHSPEQVLHSIMPHFTFMRTNVICKDDNYSFYVIEEALSSIMPVLVNSMGADSYFSRIRESLLAINSLFTYLPRLQRLSH